MQSKRMDEQRVELPHLPGLHPPTQSQMLQRLSAAGRGGDNTAPDDTFLEMLMRCQVCPVMIRPENWIALKRSSV
jgi:G-protein signaling modulator 2